MKTVQSIGLESGVRKLELFSDITSNVTDVPGMIGTLLADATYKESTHSSVGMMLRCRGIVFTS